MHFFYNNEVEQAIIQACAWSDRYIIAKLIAIGDSYKECVNGNIFLIGGNSKRIRLSLEIDECR